MLAAAIDAGSNTLRLLIGKVVDGRVVPELYQRRICRLAGNFSQQEGLSAEARERALSVFREFSLICNEADVQRSRVVGTAAFRQAVNGENFADQVREMTGLPLEVITGEEEAFYTARGVVSALDPVPAQALIFDIGGGSTEFILCVDGRVAWSRSFSLGVVHLTEAHTSPVARQAEISKTLALVQAELQRACISSGADLAKLILVGTAGTVTTLAALDMQMSEYDWRRVNNYSMLVSHAASLVRSPVPDDPAGTGSFDRNGTGARRPDYRWPGDRPRYSAGNAFGTFDRQRFRHPRRVASFHV